MTELASQSLLAVFLIFCRVGACMMVLPGFASQQLPARVRLLVAIGCTLALAPPLLPDIEKVLSGKSVVEQIMLLGSEIGVGLLIGLFGRYFFLALEFVGAAVSTFLGYGGAPGVPIEDTEPTTALGSIITLSATVLIFLSDLHLEVIRALIASYSGISIGPYFDTGMALHQLVGVAAKAFAVAVQVGGPFLVYSIVINLMFSLVNKLTPQVPIYFISIPFVIFGGLGMLVLVAPEFVWIFMQSYTRWLVSGTP